MNASSPPKVFVTREIPAAGLTRLEGCDVEVWREPLPPSRSTLLEKVAGCDGILALLTEKVDAELLDAAGPQLKVVSNFAVGYNNIDIEEASRRGIRVGNTPDVLTEATADIAFALMIAASRRLIETSRFIQAGKWQTWDPMGHIGLDLTGRTIGIVGMGRIGAAMARRCHGGWGMKVLYHNRSAKPSAEKEFGAKRVDMDTLLAESDFISVHASLNDSTNGMFDAAAFKKMKESAVFVNTARGALHNQPDLTAALQNGDIFAAGLDVTDPEPPAADDPLLSMDNCVIAPHIGSATISSRNGMAEIAADNLLAGLDNKPLRCWVNADAFA